MKMQRSYKKKNTQKSAAFRNECTDNLVQTTINKSAHLQALRPSCAYSKLWTTDEKPKNYMKQQQQ